MDAHNSTGGAYKKKDDVHKMVMKWANILTFNTRAIVLFVVVLTGVPWVYFVFELTVMNLLFFYMRSKHEALCARLTNQLQTKA